MTRPTPRRSAHSVHLLNLHLVFCVKYRRKALTASILPRLEDGTRRMLPAIGCELFEFSGETDHVHFLIHHPPSVSVSEMHAV